MSENLTLRTWIGSISDSEHLELRRAISAIASTKEAVYLDTPEGQAAIVSAEAAQWWEAYVAGICLMCASGSHPHCSRYSGTECNCMNAEVHQAIEMERAARAGLLSRRHR